MPEARLFVEDRSILRMDGGLPPENDRDDPRAGGGAGNEIVEGDVNVLCEEPLTEPGRRDGGGGGTRTLSDDGLLFSIPTPGILGDSSSGFGDSLVMLALFDLDSDTIWLCRRESGGAGGFLCRTDEDGDDGSGVFPAASLSNTDSRSESWLARFGAGGRGLLRSVCERGPELK